MNKLVCCFLSLLFFALSHISIQAQQSAYLQAPYDYVIQKQYYKKQFGDITTYGRFMVLKITFTNKDSENHTIDYECFKITDQTGIEYQVHLEATIVRQTRFEDWKFKDLDVTGLNRKILKPNAKVSGYLVFEVPSKGDYQLEFKGYINSQDI